MPRLFCPPVCLVADRFATSTPPPSSPSLPLRPGLAFPSIIFDLLDCGPKSMQMPTLRQCLTFDVTHPLSHSRPPSLPAAPFRLMALRHPGTPRSHLFLLPWSIMTILISIYPSNTPPLGLRSSTLPPLTSLRLLRISANLTPSKQADLHRLLQTQPAAMS